MRVISGSLRGRHLVSFKADHLRPTTDRTKESIFNKLHTFIEGARVLDLFAGTGNLGIEAYSRGAGYVESVEMNAKSLSIIQQNLQNLQIQDRFRVVRSDVFKYLNRSPAEAFDLIFIDPPFTEKIAHEVMLAVAMSPIFHDESIIVIESEKRERIDTEYPPLEVFDQKTFSDKVVSFYKRKDAN